MESIFTVPRAAFFDGSWPQGFLPLSPALGERWIEAFEARGSFRDRESAETDPSHKQPIPYCVLRRGGELFTMRRLVKGSEQRLHGRASLGVGGHVDAVDGPAEGCLRRGLRRELTEEVSLESPGDPLSEQRIRELPLLGLINDDSNPVGQVHIGLAFLLELEEGTEARPRETEKIAGRFEPLVESDSLWQDPLIFESWSELFLAAIRGKATTSVDSHLP